MYSLAATVWHLLVGRSPFEQPGRDNSHYALMKRIRDLPVPDTGRPDVPASLERLLKAGMARDPGLRPASAMDFARSLQVIEQELRLPRTEIVVAEDVAAQVAAGDARIMGVMIESHLEEGRQDIVAGQQLKPGVSVTDACISFAQTVPVLDGLAEAVRARRSKRG